MPNTRGAPRLRRGAPKVWGSGAISGPPFRSIRTGRGRATPAILDRDDARRRSLGDRRAVGGRVRLAALGDEIATELVGVDAEQSRLDQLVQGQTGHLREPPGGRNRLGSEPDRLAPLGWFAFHRSWTCRSP